VAIQSFQILPEQNRMLAWYLEGDVVLGTEQCITYTLDRACTGLAVSMHVQEAPVGAALIADLNENGVSMFSTKPQIAAGQTTGGGNAVFSDTALAAGAEITLDIDQKGSTTPGADLTVILEAKVA